MALLWQDVYKRQPAAVRAVANANGANPMSIFVPCHRVIGSDRSLTGYGGGPVSYTHLDVYKRQHNGHVAAITPAPDSDTIFIYIRLAS